MTSKWNGKITSLSISAEGCPELYQELSRTSHRERSARLRTLALIGLFALQQHSRPALGIVADEIKPTTEPKAEDSTALTRRKGLLAEKLRASA